MSRKRGSNETTLRLDERRTIARDWRWYAVSVSPGRETACAIDCSVNGIGVWLPHFRSVTTRRRKRVELDGLFFPGYLFVGIPDRAGVGRVSNRKYVREVLGIPGPMEIPAIVVQAIADRLTGDTRSERLAVAAAYRVGEIRQLVQGPFASFMGQITELLATGRIKVDVDIFGRAVPVEIDPQYLAAA